MLPVIRALYCTQDALQLLQLKSRPIRSREMCLVLLHRIVYKLYRLSLIIRYRKSGFWVRQFIFSPSFGHMKSQSSFIIGITSKQYKPNHALYLATNFRDFKLKYYVNSFLISLAQKCVQIHAHNYDSAKIMNSPQFTLLNNSPSFCELKNVVN